MSAPTSETVRERPILFSGAMVRAILAGRKTQTRRVVNPQPGHIEWFEHQRGWCAKASEREWAMVRCPYGAPGDALWVREAWGFSAGVTFDAQARFMREQDRRFIVYRADEGASAAAWGPSIFMPRWASRLSLRVTGVRVERLQEISEDDARAEGMGTLPAGTDEDGHPFDASDHRTAFRVGWDTINGKRAPWALNPWVWVVSFEEAGRVGN